MENLDEFINSLDSELNEVETTMIKVKHPGILEIPEGKNFWDVPISHFKKLIAEKGHGPVMKALLNLERWNKNKEPRISARARKIIDAVKEKNEDLELDEAMSKDPRKEAKKLFMGSIDPNIVDLDDLYDVMIGEDPDSTESRVFRKEVKKIIMDYIKQTKTFIKSLK